MSRHIRRLARFTVHAPIPHLSPTSRHRLRKTQSSTLPDYPTPFDAQAHPLQLTTAALHVTPVEMVILLGALGILVALLCWIGWIIVTYAFQFIKDRMYDFNVGKRDQNHTHRREQEIEDAPRIIGSVIGRVGSVTKHLFEGLMRSGSWYDREGEERRGLLGKEGEGNSRTYTYHESTIISGDGASESTGSGKTTVIHIDDCMGQCGQARKRSIDV